MPYRLHIDIPLEMTEEEAKNVSISLLSIFAGEESDAVILNALGVTLIFQQLLFILLGICFHRSHAGYAITNVRASRTNVNVTTTRTVYSSMCRNSRVEYRNRKLLGD